MLTIFHKLLGTSRLSSSIHLHAIGFRAKPNNIMITVIERAFDALKRSSS